MAAEGASGRWQSNARSSTLTRLRQICCDPHLIYENYKGQSAKLDTCMELILSGVEAGHKILLFSQFTSMLELIGARMKKEGISYYQLTGETSKEDRLKLVQAFHKDETPVFLIFLKSRWHWTEPDGSRYGDPLTIRAR